MTAWERAGWCVAACTLLATVAFNPALRALRPDLAVVACGLEDNYEWLVPRRTDVDPWGTPWLVVDESPTRLRLWSVGPDRLPGTGDEIEPARVCSDVGLGPRTSGPVWFHLALRGAELLALATITFVWCLVGPFRRSRRAPLGRELARAALLASVPAGAIALALDWFLRTAWWRHLDRMDVLIVPWRVAAAGSVALVCGLAALAWRLREPAALVET